MSLLLSPWLLRVAGAAAILAGAAWAYNWWADGQREIGRQEIRPQVAAIQAAWDADKLARAEANRLLVAANAKTSSNLQAAADKERQALNEKNRTIGRDLAAALDSLRNRPERPEPADRGERVPEVAGAGAAGPGNAGCTGDRLYRDDSEALVRLGAAGDRLRIALQSCRAARERDQAAVNGG